MTTNNTVSISEARKRIFEIAENVQVPGQSYVLTEKGKPKAVMLSVEEYESFIETLRVLQESPHIREEIKQMNEDIRSGEYRNYPTMQEVFEDTINKKA